MRWVSILVTLTGLVVACGDEDPVDTNGGDSSDRDRSDTVTAAQPTEDGSALCRDVQTTFFDCGLRSLVDNGTLGCSIIDAPSADPCEIECLADATCDELGALLCDGATSVGLDECALACADTAAHSCEVVLPNSWLCDGEADCVDGSDEEQDCPTPFECDDGDILPSHWECDGFPDCALGEDEHDECQPFECDDGQLLSPTWECDGMADCSEGEDEHDECETVSCDDGSTIPPSFVCDDFVDCPGGEDEADCTAFICEYVLAGAYVCDGVAQCEDSSDEPSRCADSGTFSCDSGEQIPADWECDNEEDCEDGSDEHRRCAPPPTFECDDGSVLPEAVECDRFVDCGDATDEHDRCWYRAVCSG